MVKDNLDKILVISFKINESCPFFGAPRPFLEFMDSNYDLSSNEILRAKLRPDKLTLDNKVAYVKSTEDAYHNRSEENMLKIYYRKFD